MLWHFCQVQSDTRLSPFFLICHHSTRDETSKNQISSHVSRYSRQQWLQTSSNQLFSPTYLHTAAAATTQTKATTLPRACLSTLTIRHHNVNCGQSTISVLLHEHWTHNSGAYIRPEKCKLLQHTCTIAMWCWLQDEWSTCATGYDTSTNEFCGLVMFPVLPTHNQNFSVLQATESWAEPGNEAMNSVSSNIQLPKPKVMWWLATQRQWEIGCCISAKLQVVKSCLGPL